MRHVKGISLPIEIVVVLAIGVVIVATILFLTSRSFGTATDEFELQKALQNACQIWATNGCRDPVGSIEANYIKSGRTGGACSTADKGCPLYGGGNSLC